MLIEIDQDTHDTITCHLRLLDRYYELPNADPAFMEAARPIVVGVTALRGAFYVPDPDDVTTYVSNEVDDGVSDLSDDIEDAREEHESDDSVENEEFNDDRGQSDENEEPIE